MSIWIKSGDLPECTPVNIERCYAICFDILPPEELERRMKQFRPRFRVYFFPGCSMQEEECEVSWAFEDYETALRCYNNIQAMLGVVPL